jgi:hypothetical protein
MVKQASPAATELTPEEAASRAAERAVASTVGRPLGLVAAVLGFGLGLAALGSGQFTAAVGWLTLGSWGLAAAAVGREGS